MKIRHILIKPILLCCALICLNGADLLAQEKQIEYKVKVEVKLLYVLALDKEGYPVTDLQKEDFQLFVDDQPQEIETFSLITHTAKRTIAEPKDFDAERFDIQDISAEEARGNKRFILAAIPSGLRFISISQLMRARRALIHLIENARYPEDWIAIVVVNRGWIDTIQDFTPSKEKLLQKIDAYFNLDRKKFARLENQYRVSAEEIYQVPQLPIFQGFIPLSGGIDIIPALKLIAERMGILMGRKIILCLGVPIDFLNPYSSIRGSSTSIRLWSALEMIDKVIYHDITIYYTELQRPDAWSIRDLRAESSHFALANETGGKYYHNVISPTYFIDDIDKINSSYYLISFTVTEEYREKKSHNIRLICKRKGVKLYYGNKFYIPEELEEKKFEETYKKVNLYKCLLSDVNQSALKIYGQWIPLPTDDEQLHLGAVDFYLPTELFQTLPILYQLGCSYSDSQEKGIIFQEQIIFSPTDEDKLSASHGYVLRLITKLPEGGKILRLAAMDEKTGEYGIYDVDISKYPKRSDFSNILLGRLLEEGPFYECREYCGARFDLKKELFDLLSVNNSIIIPSINNTFRHEGRVAFCLIRKIPPKQSKRYDKHKVIAYLSPIENEETMKIKLPVHRKKVLKNYRQYYGIINTTNLKIGRYRLKLDIKDANNYPVAELEANLQIIQ